MGYVIGSYVAFILMELAVAMPVYYLLRAILKKKYIEWIALAAIIAGIGAGWVAGYRVTQDVMVENYLQMSNQQEIVEYGRNLSQEKWSDLIHEFVTDPKNVQEFNVGAAKASLPSAIFVAILLFWLAERQKRKLSAENEDKEIA